MTPQDFEYFSAQFRRLSSALDRYKQDPDAVRAKTQAYFDVLQAFPLGLVVSKADAWLAKESKFPTPAQWAGMVVSSGPELQLMTPQEASDHRRAELLTYEDQPCDCPLCVQAGVTERPLRYVPTLDRDDRTIKMLDPSGKKIVTIGHWAHGYELARYYQAVADFWEMAYRRFHKIPTTGRLDEQLGTMLAEAHL